MRNGWVVLTTACLLLASCSDGGTDAGSFEGDPIAGGSTAGNPSDGSGAPTEDRPGRVELSGEELVDELVDGNTPPASDDVPEESVPDRGSDQSGVPSVRESLVASGLAEDQVSCMIDHMTSTLGVTEAELDALTADDPSVADLANAGESALAECVEEDGDPSSSAAGSTLAAQLIELGLTATEANCLADLYAKGVETGTTQDFLGCVPLDRLIAVAG